jgi:hypothetical protein
VPKELKELMMNESKKYTLVEYISSCYFVIKLIESKMDYIKIKDRWVLVEQFFKVVPTYAVPMCDKVEVVNILISYMLTIRNDDEHFEELPSRSRSMSGGGMGNLKHWVIIIIILSLFSAFVPMLLGTVMIGQRMPKSLDLAMPDPAMPDPVPVSEPFDAVRDTQNNLRLMGIETQLIFTQHPKYNIQNYPLAIETSDDYIVGRQEFGILKTNLNYSELRSKLLTTRPPATAKHFDQFMATVVWPEIHPDHIDFEQKKRMLMTDQNYDDFKSDEEYIKFVESNPNITPEQKVYIIYYIKAISLSKVDYRSLFKEPIERYKKARTQSEYDSATKFSRKVFPFFRNADDAYKSLMASSPKARKACKYQRRYAIDQGEIYSIFYACLDNIREYRNYKYMSSWERHIYSPHIYSPSERRAIEFRQWTMLPTSVFAPNTRYLAMRQFGPLAPSGIPLEFQKRNVLVHYTSFDYAIKVLYGGPSKFTSNAYRRENNVSFTSYYTELDVFAKNKMFFHHETIAQCASQNVGIYFGYFSRESIDEFFDKAMKSPYKDLIVNAIPLVFDWRILDDHEWTFWKRDACGRIYDGDHVSYRFDFDHVTSDTSGTKYNSLALPIDEDEARGTIIYKPTKSGSMGAEIHHKGEFVLRTDGYVKIQNYLDDNYFRKLNLSVNNLNYTRYI